MGKNVNLRMAIMKNRARTKPKRLIYHSAVWIKRCLAFIAAKTPQGVAILK